MIALSGKARYWLLGLLITGLLSVGFLVAIPYVISWQVQQYVLKHGGDQVQVENVDFNPFTATLNLTRVSIKRGDETPLILPELNLHVVWKTLLDKRFVINEISIRGVRLLIDSSVKGELLIGGILNKTRENSSASTEQPERPWKFHVKRLSIIDTQITYRDQRLKSVVQIDYLELEALANFIKEQQALLVFEGAIDHSPLHIQGEMQLFADTRSFNGRVFLDKFDIRPYVATALKDGKLDGLLSINSFLSVNYDQNGQLLARQQGRIATRQTRWRQQDLDIRNDGLSWNGNMKLEKQANGNLVVMQDGQWSGQAFLMNSGETVRVSNRSLQFDGALQLSLSPAAGKNTIKLHHDGRLQLDGTALSQSQNALEIAALVWKGISDVQIKADEATELEFGGELTGRAMHLDSENPALLLQLASLENRGNIQITLAEQADINLDSRIDMENLLIRSTKKKRDLLKFGTFRADDFRVAHTQDVQAGSLSVTGLAVGSREKHLEQEIDLPGWMSAGRVHVKDFSLDSQQGIKVASVDLGGISPLLVLSKDGQWNVSAFIREIKSLFPAKADTDTKPAPAPAIRIGKITIDDKSGIYFVDHSAAAEPVVQKLRIERFRLEQIDSSQPDSDTRVDIKTQIGQDARFDVSGTLKPFADRLTLDLKGDIKGLSLLPVAPYLEKVLGYQIDSGELNADISARSEQGKLDVVSELALHQLDLAPLTEAQLKILGAKPLSGLESGLSLLKDKNDTIKLSLPVSGDIASLEVDPADIINQAIGKALAKGAKVYFAAALFPFGTLLVIADMAVDEAMRVRLDPVMFEADSTRLNIKYHEYLQKVAKILDEKPEIHVKVCGYAVKADASAIQKRLMEAKTAQKNAGKQKLLDVLGQLSLQSSKKIRLRSTDNVAATTIPAAGAVKSGSEVSGIDIDAHLKKLATRRADVVRKYFVNDQGVDATRLIDCLPKTDRKDGDQLPRAELLL